MRTDEQIAELTRAIGGNVVPAILVGQTAIKGFDETGYHRALDIAGYPKQGELPPRSQVEPKAPPPKPAEPQPAEPAEKKEPSYSGG